MPTVLLYLGSLWVNCCFHGFMGFIYTTGLFHRFTVSLLSRQRKSADPSYCFMLFATKSAAVEVCDLVQNVEVDSIGLKIKFLVECFFSGLISTHETTELCWTCYPNGPEAGREAGWGSEFVPLKKRQAGSFILLHKISRTACCFGIRTFLKQYSCYESATNWYTDHQYLAQYSDIINNLQEIPLIFCNYAVRSCGTWRKGPGQSPCNGLSISDLELYVTETSTGVCDPVTD